MTLCPLCERREPHRPDVCEACRDHHVCDLDELVELWPLVPAAVEPSLALSIWQGQRVSGSREPSAPLVLAALDLALPARGDVSDVYGDQSGAVPVAGVLDVWVRWVAAERAAQGAREALPVPTVVAMATWLRVRADWTCDRFGAITDYAGEVRGCLAEVRRVLRITRQDRHYPVPCPHCGRLALRRRPGGRYIECRFCDRLLDDDAVTDLAEMVESYMSD